MTVRDHNPVPITEFNGLWRRGDIDSTPHDHFSDCNNIQFIQGGFEWRSGIDTAIPIPNVRMYTFVQETGSSILALDVDGNIYDSGSATPTVPILTIAGMTDFGYVSIGGRAYLTPSNGVTGLAGEFVYVYEGDGSSARKAAGDAPTGTLVAANSGTAGNVELGVHVFGVVFETDSGFLTSIGPTDQVTLPSVTADGTKKVDISGIPVSASSTVVNVHVVATKAIPSTFYNGDTRGYEFFFIPGAIVANGVTTLTVNFFDSELLESADHLFDLFDEIPAGVGLSTYHGRMVVWATATDISTAYLSSEGEPEAINQVDGLIIFPLDGNPLTVMQEFRDVLYGFKQTRTNAWNDNGDVPSAWPMTVLDQGLGCSLHGMGTVLDSGGVNIDYLILTNYTGVMLFNGAFVRPELTWKIHDFWEGSNTASGINFSNFNTIQLLNDTVSQVLYILLPDGKMLIGDYQNGLDPKNIRWTFWTFRVKITSITLIDINTLYLSSIGELFTGEPSST